MRSNCRPGSHEPREPEDAAPRGRFQAFLCRWFVANSVLAGFFALAWLLLRSGTRPSRLAYPCQRAALSTAWLAFAAPLLAALAAARRQLANGIRSPLGLAAALVGLAATLVVWGHLSGAGATPVAHQTPPRDYRAQVFHITDCPKDPVGDRFPGLDNLFLLMGRQGLKLYRSATLSTLGGPDGIIAGDDVVVIKINYQWDERGGSNTDVLRGLIRAIVDHPDTFNGEVVVCENAQFNSTSGFDRADNNAEDHSLSPHDVVVHFQGLGYKVSHFDWTPVRFTSVDEYSAGDSTDGYVVYGYSSEYAGRVSYPKFKTSYGTHISLRDGIWDSGSSSYDRDSLKFVNLPVLKSHHAVYGATACVKHYMGVVTTELSTSSHTSMRYGLLGALIAEIGLADLNILDCIWVNANPYDGPWTSYGGATRLDLLVASTDPVAADIWAVKEILIPAFVNNGYSPPWPDPNADHDDPNSDFRTYLDSSMDQILDAGLVVTNDLGQIDAHSWDGVSSEIFADGFESGNVAEWS